MAVSRQKVEALQALARYKASEYAEREDLAAVAITGALRYMRALLSAQFDAEVVQPVLALGPNLEVRRRRVLRQVEALLVLCGA